MQIQAELTEFPEVNQTASALSESLLKINRDQIVGIYLSGSIALGDFQSDKSDIDFVVATKSQLDEQTLEKIEKLHQDMRVSQLPYADNIEGDYIPIDALRKHDPQNSTYPHLGTDGHFAIEQHASNEIVQRYILRENGVVIFGPPPKELVDEVPAEELQKSMRAFLHEWWEPQLEDTIRLETDEYQAYGILTMCRILYTLKFGKVVSKKVAADWAIYEFSDRFDSCIELSLRWQKDKKFDCFEKTKELIAFTIEKAGENEEAGTSAE